MAESEENLAASPKKTKAETKQSKATSRKRLDDSFSGKLNYLKITGFYLMFLKQFM